MEFDSDYEVVISGVGGYFPSCRNIEVFQEGLLSNKSLMSSRWKTGERGVTNVIGTVPSIEYFDASYFGIHREQCNLMDPMQRMVLERSYEALIDAGVNPVDLKGKNIAVFGGASVGENDNLFYEVIASGFGITGHSRSMLPNRVSYWLNANGPSCAYDNNWLNGAEVLYSAYEVVRTGQCEAALIATANLALNSEISWQFNDMGLLSPDGSTRSFDANANGYGRSDGIIAMYIQRACDAKRTYATILGVDICYDGHRKGTFRTADTNNMSEFIQKFYNNCKVNPRDVEFVECYGCGHKNIDKAELDAIDRVYCKDRESPLLVGCVKSNAGHAEASAILTSLAKVIIAMETGIIPANINYETPNPEISGLVDGRIEVVTENRKWNSGLAAVSGIGLSSSYGHILLKANPKIKGPPSDSIPRLINVSTRTEEGIQNIISTLKSGNNIDYEYACLTQETFKTSIPAHLYRAYAVLDGTEQPNAEFQYFPGYKRPVWFVYSGMGSQWCKMANDLMAIPLFANAIYKCHKILEPKGIDLLSIVTSDNESIFENILNSFVGIAAVQIGLTDILHAVGIVPDGIIGHSVGELGCAYADGCLTAEQMILCAYSRGKASLEATLIRGMMAAIGKGYNQMKDQCPASIEVACHNGPDSCTISGPTEDMEAFVKQLQDEGIFARLVNVSNIAYHSRYIKPAAPLLLQYLQKVIPQPLPRSSKWISTSLPEDKWNTDLAKTSSAEYHTNNLLSSVLFEEGSSHIPKEAIVIEIAPHGLLQAILKRSLKANTVNIPLTHKSSKNGLTFLLSALGKLYMTGMDLNISAVYPKVEYPVSRGTRSLTSLIYWEHGEAWRSGIQDKLSQVTGARDLDISLKSEEYKVLAEHQLQNTAIVPITTYLVAIYKIFNTITSSKVTDIIIEDLQFKNTVCVPKIGNVSVNIMVQKGSGGFEISSGNDLIATGRIRYPESEKVFADVENIEKPNDSVSLDRSDVYNEFSHRHHKYGKNYQFIKSLCTTEAGSVSKVEWNNNWLAIIEAMFQQYLFRQGQHLQKTLTISKIQKIVVSHSALPTESDDLEVYYNYHTGILFTAGIQIFGMNSRILNLDYRKVSYNAVVLKPLMNAQYQCIESGINIGLQLALDNFEVKPVRNAMIIEIQTKNAFLENSIKKVINSDINLKTSFSSVQESKDVLISHTQPVYIIVNDMPDRDCINLLASSHAVLLAHTGDYIKSTPEITRIAEFSIDGVSYSLIKKTTSLLPIIVTMTSNSLTAKDLFCENLPWVIKLRSAISAASGQKVYLASTVVPMEGISNFYKYVTNCPGIQNIRFIFDLDKTNPFFSTNEANYQDIFKNDITLSVVKNCCINTFTSTPVEFEGVKSKKHAMSNIVDDVEIEYIGINAQDETILFDDQRTSELGNIDYSGTTRSGENVMGLAYFKKELSKLIIDPILRWPISGRMSIQDGATIPNAYVLAYYSLVIAGRCKPSHTVLVHGACTPVGTAAICISLRIGCSIIGTVTSVKQKKYLMKKFDSMDDNNIFICCNTSFEPRVLLATGGRGAHVIINCLSGNLLHATFRCVAAFGKMIQIGKLDVENNTEVGMIPFLNNVSMATVTIEDIFNAPANIKQQIHSLVSAGIKNFSVRPTKRTLFYDENLKSILSSIKEPEFIGKGVVKLSDKFDLSGLNIKKTSQFLCNVQDTYVLIGDDDNYWIDLLEWLVHKGAQKLLIAASTKSVSRHVQRRLSLYQKQFTLNITFASAIPDSKENIAKLLSQAYQLGPIASVFVLPTTRSALSNINSKAVQLIDYSLRTIAPQALLINFFNNATGICYLRSESGFPTYSIEWEDGLEFSDALYSLDEIISFTVANIIIKNEQSKETIEESTQSLYKKLILLLPTSIDSLKQEASFAPSKPDFRLLPSLCDSRLQEVPPVFIFPRMFTTNFIENLASRLYYPIYCANLPKTQLTCEEIAKQLAVRMKEIYPSGPYNLIGVSYGGVLAIEVAKLLQQENYKTSVQLLDGAPDTVQGVLRHLGEGSEGEIGFLCRILNLTNLEIVEKLSNLENWNDRLRFALGHYESSLDDKILLTDVLTTMKEYLDEISNFKPSQSLIDGQIALLRPKDSNKYDACGLQKYCKQNAEISLIDGDHSTILMDKATSMFINNKVIC